MTVYGTRETGNQTATGAAILSADVRSSLELLSFEVKKNETILFWEKAASAR